MEGDHYVDHHVDFDLFVDHSVDHCHWLSIHDHHITHTPFFFSYTPPPPTQAYAENLLVRVMQYTTTDIKILVGSGMTTVRDTRLAEYHPTVLHVGRVGEGAGWLKVLQDLRSSELPLVRRVWPAQQHMVCVGGEFCV